MKPKKWPRGTHKTITNGVVEKSVLINSRIPVGWRRGRKDSYFESWKIKAVRRALDGIH